MPLGVNEWDAMRRKVLLIVGVIVALGALAILALALGLPSLLRLATMGEQRKLADSDAAVPARPDQASLLLLAIDGVDRKLMYDLLQQGELPIMGSLLAGTTGQFPHAYFEPNLLSTLPSSTLAAWATVFTGVNPARHGVAGNEYFIREDRRLAAPAPVSILNPEPVLKTYTEGYANQLLQSPTLYERALERRHDLSSWVSMSQFYAGATRLLLADRTVVADAFQALLTTSVKESAPDGIYAELDEEVIDTLCDALEKSPAPHIITLYLTGTDHHAHGAVSGPDPARSRYLREVVDPALARLRDALNAQHALDSRYVVVTSDHGHTAVMHDEKHALSTGTKDDPPAVIRNAGYRLRPFDLELPDSADFQTVLAYGGAMAYVYVADRSTCEAQKSACDWRKPPRFEQDVLPLAEAFHQANLTGHGAPGMRGTLDFVLTRHARPFAEDDLPFEVYVGGGRLEGLAVHLEKHPREQYVAFESRLKELAVGRYGERAGDVLLLARNGNVERAEERYYFATMYHSWHGSPSRRDSEVPFILAHPKRSTAELAARARQAFGAAPRQQDIARLLLELLVPEPLPD